MLKRRCQRLGCAVHAGSAALFSNNNMTLLPRSFARAGFAACAGLMCSALLLTGCQEKRLSRCNVRRFPSLTSLPRLPMKTSGLKRWAKPKVLSKPRCAHKFPASLKNCLQGRRSRQGRRYALLIDQDTYRAAYNAAVAERKQVEAQLVQERREAERYKRLYESKATSKKPGTMRKAP